MDDDCGDVTRLLEAYRLGDKSALEALIPLVYAELRDIAGRLMWDQRPEHTLQPTALVNEAFVRMAGQRDVRWVNRPHLLGCAAHVMRSVLVDHARAKRAAKRGAGVPLLELDERLAGSESPGIDVLALDEALGRLAALSERQCRTVEMRYFGGMTAEECAEALGVSRATVERDLTVARAWLRTELAK